MQTEPSSSKKLSLKNISLIAAGVILLPALFSSDTPEPAKPAPIVQTEETTKQEIQEPVEQPVPSITNPPAQLKPTCTIETVSSTCTSCNTAVKARRNTDCSITQQTQTDTSCSYLCEPEEDEQPAPVVKSSGYTCNCSKTCPQMSSCSEAQYQLNTCGCSARDADDDGIACDAQCQ